MEFSDVTLIPVNGDGPEDVVVDAEGYIYTGLDDGRIQRISPDGARLDTVADVGDRVYGVELYGDDELLACAGHRGLLAVDRTSGKVRTLADRVDGTSIGTANNAAVAADGTVYFSDSSTAYPIPEWRTDLMMQSRTGRLLRLDTDGAVTVLLDGLGFANGVALAPDESFVTVAETFAYRVHRVWLSGPKAGSSDVFVDDLSGFPDNVSTGSDGLIWVAIPSPRVSAVEVIERLPRPARALISKLPERMHPSPGRTVSVVGVDTSGSVVKEHCGEIDGFHLLTGVRERHGSLYLGSLESQAVAVVRG